MLHRTRYRERGVGEKDWAYVCRFRTPPDIAGSALLRFEGLDTLAQAYLNGAWIGRFENMFREYAVDVKARLAPAGEMNTLIVIFSSALQNFRSTGLPQNDPAFPGHKSIRKLDGEESRKSERPQTRELSHCGFLQSEGQRRLMATSSPGRGAASRPLFRRLADEIAVGCGQVHVLLRRGGVRQDAKPQAEALAEPCREAKAMVRKAPAKNVDETGWKRAGR
ncbi:MAG: hypothetical protein NTU53_02265 [Planctomycetota bacterium]|nr:hypothetical protein [Planctomycetota bacterium]